VQQNAEIQQQQQQQQSNQIKQLKNHTGNQNFYTRDFLAERMAHILYKVSFLLRV
jgi:hypothetical protein